MPGLYNFLIYSFISAYTPGPNNLMSMSNAVRLGFKKSFPFNLGILGGSFIVITICTIFSASLYQFIPKVKIVMQIFGAAYMLFLAWKVWRSSSEVNTKDAKEASFLSAILLQFVNPKIYIGAITGMSSYILPFYQSTVIIFSFSMSLVAIVFSSSVIWALFGLAFGKVLARHSKVINTVMALLLVYCAVSLFL